MEQLPTEQVIGKIVSIQSNLWQSSQSLRKEKLHESEKNCFPAELWLLS